MRLVSRLDQAGGGKPYPSGGVDLEPGTVTALAQISLKKEHDARLCHFLFPCPPVMSGRPSSQPLRAAGGEGQPLVGCPSVSLGVPAVIGGHRISQLPAVS